MCLTTRFTTALAGFLSLGLIAAGFAALVATTPPAKAQGTMISPGGQSRVTAPGGLRGRAVHRHRPHHRMHRRRH